MTLELGVLADGIMLNVFCYQSHVKVFAVRKGEIIDGSGCYCRDHRTLTHLFQHKHVSVNFEHVSGNTNMFQKHVSVNRFVILA